MDNVFDISNKFIKSGDGYLNIENNLYYVKIIKNKNVKIAVKKYFKNWENSVSFIIKRVPSINTLDIFNDVIMKNINEKKYIDIFQYLPIDITGQFDYFVTHPEQIESNNIISNSKWERWDKSNLEKFEF